MRTPEELSDLYAIEARKGMLISEFIRLAIEGAVEECIDVLPDCADHWNFEYMRKAIRDHFAKAGYGR